MSFKSRLKRAAAFGSSSAFIFLMFYMSSKTKAGYGEPEPGDVPANLIKEYLTDEALQKLYNGDDSDGYFIKTIYIGNTPIEYYHFPSTMNLQLCTMDCQCTVPQKI